MEKRTILAVIISLGILILYQEFIASRFLPPPPPAPVSTTELLSKSGGDQIKPQEEVAEMSPPPPVRVSPEAEEEIGKILAAQAEAQEEEISVETELITAIISTRGGIIKSWRLKKYQESVEDKTPLQLVSDKSRTAGYYPLNLHYDDSALTKRVNNGIYLADQKEIFIEQGGVKQSISLSYQDPEGLKITKTITFHPDNYLIDIVISQENVLGSIKSGANFLCWGYNLGNEEGGQYVTTGPTSFIDGELITDSPDDINTQLIHKGNISWTGIQSTYFMVAFIPSTITSSASVFKTADGLLTVGISSQQDQLRPGERPSSTSYSLYVGPKQKENLVKVQKNLEKIIDYGWFHMVAEPLMEVLVFFHSYAKNWGLAIILLTVAIKLLFYPLTNASFKSMQGMQKIQPKINALRDKHKKDPAKLNAATMELYKKHKVNPLGGCLPMVLQIPVFFGLYKALLVSIELRHAPAFIFFWIGDLSAKDPLYITPIVMGITMFIQQKMTPSTGDAKQQKLMMIMPVVMTFMFLNFSSGLVIYWLINNVLTIAQQGLIKKKEEAPQK